ncbi:DUF4926 domain-containing protein [Actinocatenispora rupis]|uniref:DUF4926 domain-containing protein n=1 Tax=Actinocatenispora rupis TaxID=519421 RepID=A0A8J3ND25_9ACTN|nr:DUF4926 domain-containing protein [Actinocatenispora rupis]GID14914.1 hypothetical protein Aru02nite_58030 [Actinocatenispora rupis]
MNELDVVLLTEDLPEDRLSAGSEGTIVHVFHAPDTAYEVEFTDERGDDIQVTLHPHQLTPSTGGEAGNTQAGSCRTGL